MQLTKQRERVTITEYFHEFRYRNDRGAGFCFDCDKDGNLPQDISPEALENYRKCLDGTYDVIDMGVRAWTRSYVEPAEGICDVCGCKVVLYNTFASMCDNCGTEYNGFGQRLAPREFWGEETGETF